MESQSIGEFIRSKRKEKGLSVRELARRTGVSQPYLSQLETGSHNNPSLDILRKICKQLDVDYIDFFVRIGYITEEDIKSYVARRWLNES